MKLHGYKVQHGALAVCLSIEGNTTHLRPSVHTTLKIELSSAEVLVSAHLDFSLGSYFKHCVCMEQVSQNCT